MQREQHAQGDLQGSETKKREMQKREGMRGGVMVQRVYLLKKSNQYIKTVHMLGAGSAQTMMASSSRPMTGMKSGMRSTGERA